MRQGSVTQVLVAGRLGPSIPPMRPIAERLVLAEPAPTQVNGRRFLDDVPVRVLHDDTAGNLVGAVLQGCDDHTFIAHDISVSVLWRERP